MAATAAMILAATFSNRILTGLAVLGIGLFVLSFGLLVVELKWRRTTRENVKHTYGLLSDAVRAEVGPDGRWYLSTLHPGLTDEEELERRRQNLERRPEESEEEHRARLQRLSERRKNLRRARGLVMDVSIDELGFLTDQQESNIAELIAFFQTDPEWREEDRPTESADG
jgi:hypothetical protein